MRHPAARAVRALPVMLALAACAARGGHRDGSRARAFVGEWNASITARNDCPGVPRDPYQVNGAFVVARAGAGLAVSPKGLPACSFSAQIDGDTARATAERVCDLDTASRALGFAQVAYSGWSFQPEARRMSWEGRMIYVPSANKAPCPFVAQAAVSPAEQLNRTPVGSLNQSQL